MPTFDRDHDGSSSTPPVDAAIAAVAGRQGGIIDLGQMRSLGLGDDAVQYRLRVGRLHRLHRGVYAVGHANVGAHGRRLAAVRACGPGALLGHGTAADEWGLRRSESARIHVLVRRCGRRTADGVTVHQTRSLHPDDAAVLHGIPITSVERTIIDCAAGSTFHRVERMLHEAEVLRLLDVTTLRDALARANGRRGLHHITAAIATPSPGPTRRELEDRFLALIRRHGLETPLLNAAVTTRLGALEVDALWPAEKLVVELDGAATHHTRQAFEHDRLRDAALAAARHTVVRLTWHRITSDEHAVAQDLAATRSHLQSRA